MDQRFASSDTPVSFELLDICCREVAEKVDNKPVAEWTTLEYKRLSSLLNRETGILLSESTLKRIFGRLKTSERYFPQKATRDALAKFTGHRDWQEFELVHHTKKEVRPATTTTDEPAVVYVETTSETSIAVPHELPLTLPVVRKKLSWKIAVAIGMLVIIATAAVYLINPTEGFNNVKHLKLHCLNPIGEVPHSAIFRLEGASTMPPEAADLDISWGEHKFGKPFTGSNIANHLYQYPGIQYAVLSYKGRPIDTVTVQMRTHGWVANAINDLDSVRVFPVLNLKLLDPQELFASITDLARSGVDTLDSFIVGFSNIKPSNINGDNFELNVRVQASEIRTGIRCPYVLILVQGEVDRHYVRIALPNCTALTNYKFSEKEADGEITDLRHLSIDLRKPTNVKLRVSNKHAAVTADGKLIQEVTYQQGIGKVMGLKFAVNGTGRIMAPQLTDLDTGEKY